MNCNHYTDYNTSSYFTWNVT